MKDNRLISVIGNTLFLVTCFIHFLTRVNPALILINQDPVFLTGENFFMQVVSHPGGLAGFVSAWMMQFFSTPWMGALILTGMIGLVLLFLSRIVNAMVSGVAHFRMQLLPVIVLVFLVSSYDFPLEFLTGTILALSLVWIVQKRQRQSLMIRLLFLAGGFAGLYYATGGPAYLFLLLVMLLDNFSIGRKIHEIAIVLITGLVVAYFFPVFFEPNAWAIGLEHNYLKWIPLNVTFRFPGALILFLVLLILPVLDIGILSRKRSGLLDRLIAVLSPRPLQIVLFCLMLGILNTGCIFSVDTQQKSRLTIKHHARVTNWEGLLTEIRKNPEIDPVSSFQMVRALYHTGRLGDAMFLYPQEYGINGMILLKEAALPVAIEASDLWYDLAHFNEAEHWAHEAITQEGQKPWILRRLAEINLIKDNRPMALKAIELLSRTRYSDFAEKYRADLNQLDDLPQNHWILAARAMWIDSDFLIHLNLPEMDVLSILKRNPKNHMAFEYLMSYFLLARQLGWFVDEFERLQNFPYSRIPRHWEEALILFMARTGRTDPVFAGFQISRDTYDRFQAYQAILDKYGGNRESAHNELRRKFGGTYWYFLMYTQSNMRIDSGKDFDAATGATP